MAYVPNSGSVVAFQGNPSVLQVLATVTNPVSVSSVSGTVGASIIGTVPVTQVTTPWNIAGSVAAFLNSTNASVITVGSPVANQSVSGTVGASVIGHAPVFIIGGSVAATVTPAANQSVSGTVGASIIGLTPVNVTNFPTNQSVSGTVGASLIGLSPVNVTNTNINVSGSVFAIVGGLQGASVSGTVGASIIGSVPVRQSNGWQISVLSQVSGTSSTYAVLSSLSTVSILAANANRRGATIYNNAGTPVMVKLGTAATTSVFTVKMVDQSYYELPFGWTGVVAGITASNAGIITVTELT